MELSLQIYRWMNGVVTPDLLVDEWSCHSRSRCGGMELSLQIYRWMNGVVTPDLGVEEWSCHSRSRGG